MDKQILNQRIILKDDIEIVTQLPYLLGHPVHGLPTMNDTSETTAHNLYCLIPYI